MRDRLYLRTPIKPYNFSSLAIQEVAFKNDFGSADPRPQAIEITFVPPAGQSQVEIALVWDGLLRFLPDSNTLPASRSEVTEANYPNWNLTGTLILSQHDSSSGRRIRSDVPLLKNWPTTARYEKVTLTRRFLFTTLRRLQNLKFKHVDAVIDQTSDQRWFEKFVVEFLMEGCRVSAISTQSIQPTTLRSYRCRSWPEAVLALLSRFAFRAQAEISLRSSRVGSIRNRTTIRHQLNRTSF
jgi:hypothetical protein